MNNNIEQTNNKKSNKNNDWLIIAIFVLLCALVWVATSSYHSFVDKKEVVIRQELLVPLQPKIDPSLFDTLEARIHPDEEKLIEILSENSPNIIGLDEETKETEMDPTSPRPIETRETVDPLDGSAPPPTTNEINQEELPALAP